MQVASMNSGSDESRFFLAEFVKNISSKEGWWYTIPTTSTMNKISNDKSDIRMEDILPPLESIFGFALSAMMVIFYELKCLKRKGDAFIQNEYGWEFLKNQYQVENIEITEKGLSSYGCAWFIKIGHSNPTP